MMQVFLQQKYPMQNILFLLLAHFNLPNLPLRMRIFSL